jgi:hypothetical protein
MGVTIHYCGSIDELSRIEDMEDRVVDLALELGADVQVWRSASDRDPSRVVRGVFVTLVPGQEPTSLLVSPDGWLIGLADIEAAEKGEITEPPWCFVKTQFGSVEGHVTLVELLSSLKKSFLPNLEVQDESGYWERRDLSTLTQSFARSRAAIAALADAIERSTLSPEAAEDPAILATRIERIARQVQQTLGRPSEHPPVHFASDSEDEALVDPAEDEATWDELFKNNRRKQERINRAIEERMARGEDHGEAFDNAMRDELALDLPADPDFPESDYSDSEDTDDAFEGSDADEADEDETEEPWVASLQVSADEESETPSEASDDDDSFEIERHPLQRRASDFLFRLYELGKETNPQRGGHWDTLMRGAGDMTGGLAQALSGDDDWEPMRGLRIVQLKRALRGVAFARGALPPLCASGAINEVVYRELSDTLRDLNTDIHTELQNAREQGISGP